MSFIVAFWSRRIRGALDSVGAINSIEMRKFADGVLWSEVTAFGVDRSKIVFVTDNTFTHKSKIMKDYIKETRTICFDGPSILTLIESNKKSSMMNLKESSEIFRQRKARKLFLICFRLMSLSLLKMPSLKRTD